MQSNDKNNHFIRRASLKALFQNDRRRKNRQALMAAVGKFRAEPVPAKPAWPVGAAARQPTKTDGV